MVMSLCPCPCLCPCHMCICHSMQATITRKQLHKLKAGDFDKSFFALHTKIFNLVFFWDNWNFLTELKQVGVNTLKSLLVLNVSRAGRLNNCECLTIKIHWAVGSYSWQIIDLSLKKIKHLCQLFLKQKRNTVENLSLGKHSCSQPERSLGTFEEALVQEASSSQPLVGQNKDSFLWSLF